MVQNSLLSRARRRRVVEEALLVEVEVVVQAKAVVVIDKAHKAILMQVDLEIMVKRKKKENDKMQKAEVVLVGELGLQKSC